MLFNISRELLIRLDFLIALLTFELSLIYIKQWYVERKQNSKNYVSLSYGIYYFFIGLGFILYTLRRHYLISTFSWNFFYIESEFSYFLYMVTISIMGIGALIFSFTLEYNYRKFLKTRFIFSIFLLILILLLILLRNTAFFYPITNLFAGCAAFFPYLFIYYLIVNSLGKIRKKLILGAIGLTISIIGLLGLSDQGVRVLKAVSTNFQLSLIVFKLIAIVGLILLIFSFIGFSLLLEAQFSRNIISLFIIDKERGKPLYTKNFLFAGQERQSMDRILAGGLKGIVSQINELSETKKDLQIIDQENMKIILHYGDKIITALLVKIDLINIHYFLSQITSRFEENFLPIYDQWENPNLFKPMDTIINEIFPRLR